MASDIASVGAKTGTNGTNGKTESIGQIKRPIEILEEVTIRFAGDSGDGMQLTGTQFTNTTALVGNDLSTLPDYPAEIRAPAGTLYGVSGFQIHFSSKDIHTPGNHPDVLVAMNPAALKVNLGELRKGGIIIVNEDAFDDKNLRLAKYDVNPLDDDTLAGYTVYRFPLSKITLDAVKDLKMGTKEAGRSKNMVALGLLYWLYNRPMEPTVEWLKEKFGKNEQVFEANLRSLKAGYYLGETAELFSARYEIKPAKFTPGKYRNIMGNEATALGFIAASVKSGLPLFLGSYPITPASDILHELSKYKNFGVKTFQAEDEIAGITSAIGASYAGSIGITTTSGPGLALKAEAIGLAVMTELPIIIVDVQRGGPSTGLPTKTEQADLMQALYGRNGECPVAVIAAKSPADCFDTAFEAVQIALKYMVPVILLSDGYIANGAEPWLIPDTGKLPEIKSKRLTSANGTEFQPYARDENNARPWAIPGTSGLEHRIGGLEKQHITGNVNYEPKNHDFMVRLRAEKVKGIAKDVQKTEIIGPEKGKILLLGWGGTYGAITTAAEQLASKGVSAAHLRWLNPLPSDLGNILKNYDKVIIPELNLGQLRRIIRSEFLIDVIGYNKVEGLPFTSEEIVNKVEEVLTTMK
jgi:2-oxoglutarate ferredoxin oxidoreductase subunit alpha